MVHIQDTALGAPAWLLPLEPRPPMWVSDGALFHATRTIPDADRLDAAALEAAVTAAYLAIAAAITRAERHAIRFWNFVPGIHADMGGGRDRYMVFNAGRFKAFTESYGPRDAFSRALPTASAVGIREGALVIHAVAAEAPGQPIENPRQVPAYSYSERYGPLPPCFARATLLDAATPSASSAASASSDARGRRLLVGGTASILGEDSIHRDVRAQTSETFENLSKLLAVARAKAGITNGNGTDNGADADADSAADSVIASLAAFSTLRVYIVRAEDADIVREMVIAAVPRTTTVEFAQADLCRQELLVEIEGVARL